MLTGRKPIPAVVAVATALLLAILMVFAHPAHAGSFEVAPTTLSLGEAETAVFYLINHSNEPIVAQVESYTWHQDGSNQNDKDQFETTDDLIISPPMIRLMPNQRQTIRLMAKHHAGPAAQERAFRLSVSEIPDPAAKNPSEGVRMLLQFSVPVFVRNKNDLAEKVDWTAQSSAEGLVLTAHNQGLRHAKLSQITLETPSGEALPVNGGSFRYILAGSSSVWTLSQVTAASGQPLHVKAFDDIANASIDVPLTVQ